MPTLPTLEAFVATVEANSHVEAIERFYAEDASMQENNHLPRKGRDKLVANERAALARASAVRSRCIRPFLVNGDHVAIRWAFEFDYPDGTCMTLEEVAWQQWEGEKIVAEKFFYDPVQLQRQPQC